MSEQGTFGKGFGGGDAKGFGGGGGGQMTIDEGSDDDEEAAIKKAIEMSEKEEADRKRQLEEEQEINRVMEMSKMSQALEDQLHSKYDEALDKIIKQSKEEDDEKTKMIQKNDQLMQLMKQIEDDKPENWGLKKINVEDANNDNIMEIYAENMNKALKKLDLQDKIEAIKQVKKEDEPAEQKDQMKQHR